MTTDKEWIGTFITCNGKLIDLNLFLAIKEEERARIKAEWKILRKYLEDNYGMLVYSERHKVNEFEKKVFEDGN